MAKVFTDITMSLDGFIAGPNDRVEEPLSEGGERIHQWTYELETWRERQGLPGGIQNRDAEVVSETVARTGATIMGRRMLSNDEGP